jgi:hypothetical protein
MTCAFETIGTMLKSKVANVFVGVQMRLGSMSLDAPVSALGKFVLEQRAEQPGRLPALLV